MVRSTAATRTGLWRGRVASGDRKAVTRGGKQREPVEHSRQQPDLIRVKGDRERARLSSRTTSIACRRDPK